MNKEQIQQQIEELKQVIRDANNKIIELEEQLKKHTYWIPKEDDTYYFIDDAKRVDFVIWVGNQIDEYRLSIGNCYKTREEAKKKGLRKVFEQQLFTKLKRFANEYNDGNIDWNNSKQYKYCIYYDHTRKTCNINDCRYIQRLQQDIFFTSEEIAKQAIEEFKNDLIIYFTKED